MPEDLDGEVFCPHYQHAVELLGSRWTGAIVRALLGGIERFSDLTSAIPGLSDRMLAERLRELEARTVVPEMPVRIEYHLTEKGQALSGVIEAIVTWLERWGEATVVPFSHAAEQQQGFS